MMKTSKDPRRNFRESMEEMITVKGSAASEDLLACYLAVNAAKHHDLINEVFEEIWASLHTESVHQWTMLITSYCS
jgi:uncharacterized protein (TIGR01568 family)